MSKDIEQRKEEIRMVISDVGVDLGRDAYREFLDWLGGEVRCLQDCLNEEDNSE